MWHQVSSEKLRKDKNRKPPGTDNIPRKLLKYGGPEFIKKYTNLLNRLS